MNAILEFDCPHCASRLRLKAGLEPMAGPCPVCGGTVQVPAAGPLGRPGRTLLPPPRAQGRAHAGQGAATTQAIGTGSASTRIPEETAFPARTSRPGGLPRPRKRRRPMEVAKVVLSVLGVIGMVVLVRVAVLKEKPVPPQAAPHGEMRIDAESQSTSPQRGLPDPAVSLENPAALSR